ncbi:uncharacterized protein [Eurosta solidaginis]|uniref:uncharacterized protein n=1 Tax=Eurosta solidaginis TaxID=178769 RepID=UPI00353127B3
MAINDGLPVRLTSIIIYGCCGLFEFICFVVLICYTTSICVTARENSTRIWWSMNCIMPQIVPDLVFAASGFYFEKHFYAPLGGIYNISMATLSIFAGIFAFSSFTGCGNPSQVLTTVAGIFALLAGGLHIANTFMVKRSLEGDDKLFGMSEIDDD